MPESKAVIGLTWEPKLPALPFQSKTPSKSQNEPQSTAIWKPNQQLIDGLFLLPNDPSKLNKLLRKQVKDTAGTAWYLQPIFSSVFPFLFFSSLSFLVLFGSSCIYLIFLTSTGLICLPQLSRLSWRKIFNYSRCSALCYSFFSLIWFGAAKSVLSRHLILCLCIYIYLFIDIFQLYLFENVLF